MFIWILFTIKLKFLCSRMFSKSGVIVCSLLISRNLSNLPSRHRSILTNICLRNSQILLSRFCSMVLISLWTLFHLLICIYFFLRTMKLSECGFLLFSMLDCSVSHWLYLPFSFFCKWRALNSDLIAFEILCLWAKGLMLGYICNGFIFHIEYIEVNNFIK